MSVFHPLHTDIAPPSDMNNPFDYEPHPLCLLAAEEVKRIIAQQEAWQAEVALGKMFGVLVVEAPRSAASAAEASAAEASSQIGYLAAYSGQIGGRSDWEGFVPAVFDYLQPDGYFKTQEAEITALNQRIGQLEAAPERLQLKRDITTLLREAQEAIERQQHIMAASKMLRDRRREEALISEHEREAMVRESQFQKAQLRRIKRQFTDEIGKKEGKMQILNAEIRALEQERKDKSRALQRWLFSQFEMLNAQGERRNLLELFADTVIGEPPAGTGECCEPRLLQYAYAHGLRPLCMAMFWYGGHPKAEIRHHGQFYPACSGKCKPVLRWMLGIGRAGEEPSAELPADDGSLVPRVVYEDEALIVIVKPAGLLTIPGIETRQSVFTIFRNRYPDLDSPLVVHRLDMATSGLLVLAKTRDAYRKLQRQFAERTVCKRYLAILDGEFTSQTEGTISLPLRPDLLNRPRQVVDEEHGKEAVTDFTVRKVEDGRTWIELRPRTGRTHQLRVHCAHPAGLGCPIVGDTLYGRKADRLYLHAEYLELTHPDSGERLHFEAPAPF